MMTSYGVMIKLDIIESFNNAVAKDENQTEDGTVNWNYVESDVFIENAVVYDYDYLCDCFDVLVENYLD